MAKRTGPTFQKCLKEQARQQKRKDKVAGRLEAKQRRADATSGVGKIALEMAARRPASTTPPSSPCAPVSPYTT